MATLENMAYLLGVSEVSVGHLVKSGIVIKNAPGDYNGPESCRRYIEHLRKQSDAPGLTAARTQWAREKAAMAELKRKEMEGELIPKDQVWKEWSARILRCRARLLAIPSKLARQLLGVGSVVEIAKILRDEIHVALEELGRSEDAAETAA